MSDEHPTRIRIDGEQPPIPVGTAVDLSGPNGHAKFAPCSLSFPSITSGRNGGAARTRLGWRQWHRSAAPRCLRRRNQRTISRVDVCGRRRRRCHVAMEHPHRNIFYRFCCDCDNRSRATAETPGRRSAGRAPRPCASRSSRSGGARTSRGGARTSRGSARASRGSACASRCAAAVCPSLRRPARFGHGAARADATDLCGSSAATAANHRPQCRRPRWREACPTDST